MPTPNTPLQRQDLGQLAYQVLSGADQQGFIGQKVLPIFNTDLQAAEYPVITKESMLKIIDTSSSTGARANRDSWKFNLQNYSTKPYAFEEVAYDRDRALYSNLFDLDAVCVERAVNTILRDYEKRVATMTQAAVSSGSTTSAASAWSNSATATPLADIQAAKLAQRSSGGVVGNALALSWSAFQKLRTTNEIKSYFNATTPYLAMGEDAQAAIIAQYLGVKEILIAGAIADVANKAKPASIGDVWDPAIASLVSVSSGGQDLREPSFGRTFMWTYQPGIVNVKQYRDETIDGDVFKVTNDVDEAIQYIGANHRITGI